MIPQERNKVNLHLACGTVYLKGWINIDLEQPNFYLAKDRPDLVEKSGTDFEHYYKEDRSKKDFIKGKFHKKEAVVDRFADIRKLPYSRKSVDRMLGVQIFEHFSLLEAHKLLDHWFDILKVSGKLELYLPDTLGILEEYSRSDLGWTIRQLYGSQKNEYGIHKYGWTFPTLRQAFVDHGFKNIKRLPNINSYAAFGISGIK